MPKSEDETAAGLGSGASPFERRRMSAADKFPALGKIVPFSEGIASASARSRSLMGAARNVADRAFMSASAYDEDGAYPAAEVAALHEAGLLAAVLPCEFGGAGLGGLALCEALRQIGSGSLPLGRLFEGHVNAIGLILRYGRREQISLVAREVREGKMLGVWNTDDAQNLRLIGEGGRYRLDGRKILASGAGHIERPIVTATDEQGRRLIVMPHLAPGERADLSQWTAHGMRASATGAVDFSGIAVEPIEIVGSDGDYERQPAFSGGAWRFAAVHQGGMERLLDLLREHLRRTGRGGDLHQAARLGHAAIVTETARLWVERAPAIAEIPSETKSPDRIVAYVNLARLAVERAGLDLMELIHRSVGLQGFMRPNPIERISRDLATYLRQPGPDRALTSAAAWMLDSETPASDLWR
jgi:alkylation response protein AidB-like acyl-CoA dehydrogenase